MDDNTRATLILDIAKYVDYGDALDDVSEFIITVMDTDDDFYWSLERMAQERYFIQGKKIIVNLVPRPEMLKPAQVIYLNKEKGYKINDVLKQMEGWETLLMSEGYEFRESMINFRMYKGRPRFDANEELMEKHGLKVDELFMAQAIKTREDWERLYEVTDEELDKEKEVTRQQKILIEQQDSLIQAQVQRLQNLGNEIFKKELELEEKLRVLFIKNKELEVKNSEIQQQEARIRQQEIDIAAKDREFREKSENLERKDEELRTKDLQLGEKDILIREKEERLKLAVVNLQKQKLVTGAALIALVLMLGLAYFIYLNYRNKKKANILLEDKNRKITQQRDEIEKQKEIAEIQRDQIAYQKKHITDSIHYAQRIQRAILPSLELFTDRLDHFVLYKPRDIVSGDFYWVDQVGKLQIIVTADCTGHGVPGAFMSMLGISLLNEIIHTRKILDPGEVMDTMREMVIKSLNQKVGDSAVKDGMDMTVCMIDFESNILSFAGANNPLYFIRKGEFTEYKADKMPVAIHERMDPFNVTEIKLEKGDTFYTFSDGFVDQFGGPRNKKFLSKNFKTLLMEIQHLDMLDQGKVLDEKFEEYRAEVEQVDDVIVIGIRC